MSSLSYRPEIDGLRSLAVLGVVAFHLDKGLLPRGFLGVDLFFVISGFLITSIIWREQLGGTFTLKSFYEKRIRRIVPALSLVLLVTTAFATAVLLPLDLVGYGKSALATILFVANIYFWRDTDYFSRLADEKPLLHMWSLGVEEQFYIFFPILLAIVARYAKSKVLYLIAALTAGSLALNLVVVQMGNTSPAFYLLPTRAWELGAGAVLAFISTPVGSNGVRSVLGWLGIALIAAGLFGPVPDLQDVHFSMAVVLGACLIIMAGQAGPGRFLAMKMPVFFGKISYSLYLWHWPVIVLAKYYLVRGLYPIEQVGLFGLMVAMAWLSWRYVEEPFRSRRIFPVRRLLVWSAAAFAVIALASAALIASGGLPNRLSDKAARLNSVVGTEFRCPLSRITSLGNSRGCALRLADDDVESAEILVIGNSHAQMYAPLLMDYLDERKHSGVMALVHRCLPSSTVNVSQNCARLADGYIEDAIRLENARVIVIGLDWDRDNTAFFDKDGKRIGLKGTDAIIAGVEDTVRRLQAAGKHVVLIGPIDVPGWDVASIASRSMAFNRPLGRPTFEPEADFLTRVGPIIEQFANRKDIAFARVHEAQCTNGQCQFIRDGQSLFSDHHHLAAPSLGFFKDTLSSAIDRAMAKRPNPAKPAP